MNGETDLFLDSLDPYEVAILACSLPRTVIPISSERSPEPTIVLTAKTAYLWAGAIATAFDKNPEMEIEEVRSAFKRAAADLGSALRDHVFRPFVTNPFQTAEIELAFLRSFLNNLRTGDALEEIVQRTELAAQHLQWRGLIEDPLSKRVAGIVISAIMLLPFNFTEKSDQIRLESLTYEYSQRTTPDGKREREVKWKVREAMEIVIDEFIPSVVSAAGKLAGDKPMTVFELQRELKDRGYYTGEVDGIYGPLTKEAIKSFQRANNLTPTGYRDAETDRLLRQR